MQAMGGGGDELPLFQKGPPFLQALHSQMCACRFPQTQRPILCSLRDLEGSGVDEATGSWVSPCGWGVWKEKWGRGGRDLRLFHMLLGFPPQTLRLLHR